jgi:gliding motility-associated-like protein
MHKRITFFLTLLLICVLSSQTASAQCGGIDFTADTTKVCSPGVVKFFAAGAPAGSVYFWDFGTGFNAGNDTINKLYTTAGFFTVTLMTVSPLNDTCYVVKNNYIQSGLPPVPPIFASRSNLCNGGDTITFYTSNNYLQVDWILEGTTFFNAGPTKVHNFTSAGYKGATARVKDSLGCTGVRQVDSLVRINNLITVDFVADTTNGCNPLTVRFTPTFNNQGQTVSTYAWQFPGATPNTSNASNPANIIYNTQGIHSVQLDITTAAGCSYTHSKANYIRIGDALNVTFAANKTTSCRNENITYTNTTGVGLPGVFTWSLPGATIITNTQQQAQVQYNAAGQYNAQLTYSYNGCVSTTLINNYLTVAPPIVGFYSNEAVNCFAPDTVSFIDTTKLPVGGTNSYLWTFYGTDGVTVIGTSTAQNPSFIYPAMGNYAVQLQVTNSLNGCSDLLRKNAYVQLRPPTANFTTLSTEVCKGVFFQLGSTSGTLSQNAPNQYLWTFYDLDSVTVMSTSNSASPFVRYFTPGTYNILFRVFNSYGCTDDTLKKAYITVTGPTPNFSISDSLLCRGETFTLTNTTKPPINYTHTWELQNRDSSNIKYTFNTPNVTTSIPVPGMYHIKYKAENGTTCVDSVTKNNYIQVNGIDGDFTIGTNKGCKPLTTTLTSTINHNLHFTNPGDASISYQWSTTPTTGVTINAPTSASTTITFAQSGVFTIRLILINSTGCRDTITKSFIDTVGVIAGFSLPSFNCLNDTTLAINSSSINPVGFKWTSSTGVTFSPFDTSTSPEIIFADSGSYDIKMVVTNDIGCTDSLTRNIKVQKAVFDFTSTDTVNNCAPALVRYVIKPFNTVSYHFDFGDGDTITTTDTVVYHYYQFNSGGSNSGYDVCVIGRTAQGCQDTICKPKYVKVIGPAPGFTMSNNKGCGPITVNFVNNNVNVSDFYFDYGDGSSITQNAIPPHTYNVIGNVPFRVYKPYMLAFDAALCNTTYYPLDSVVVYNTPKNIGFTTSGVTGCSPFPVTFTDTTSNVSRWEWDFENDGASDDTFQITNHVYPAGDYSVKLVVYNQFGCKDSILDTLLISARPLPVAGFSLSDSVVCYNATVNFTDTSVSSDPIVNWRWNFGEFTTIADTSDLQHPSYTYTETSNHTVSLIVETSFGCVDTIILADILSVEDTLAPVNTSIRYVTVVLNSNNIKIEWDSSTISDFDHYQLDRDTVTPQTVYNGYLVTDTIFNDIGGIIDVQNSNYSYTITTIDRCGNISLPSNSHRTILLACSGAGPISNRLNWTHYVGWPSISAYRIYKSNGIGGFKLLTTLPGTDSTYLDNDLCDSNYCYYVAAVHPNGIYISESNHCCNNPPFIYPVLPIGIVKTTVRNNLFIETSWDTSTLLGNKKYLVERALNSDTIFTAINTTTGSTFIDNKVNVNLNSYRYRVRMQDHCGNLSPYGNVGTSILLTGTLQFDLPVLVWNRYNYWPNGVKQYVIQIRENNQQFKTIGTLVPGDSIFRDVQPHNDIFNPYCYRVIAIENSSVPDSSISNYACVVIPSRMYIPNSFTPNNDGLNDTFTVSSIAVFNSGAGLKGTDFEMLITDRWGAIVFRTNSIYDGWDGRHDGVELPVGVYTYLVKALGMDNVRYNLKGVIHLLR